MENPLPGGFSASVEARGAIELQEYVCVRAIVSDPILITRGKVNALTCDADGTRNRGWRCRRQMTVCEAAKPPFGPAFSLFKARLYATDLSDKGFASCVCEPSPFPLLFALRPSRRPFSLFLYLAPSLSFSILLPLEPWQPFDANANSRLPFLLRAKS